MTDSMKCDQSSDCTAAVAYIDAKGYVYCIGHGVTRGYVCPCRKLRPSELHRLAHGRLLPK